MKKAFCLLLTIFLCATTRVIASAETIEVIGDDVKAYTGSGSASDPFHYLFDNSSKVTWKHLCDVKDQDLTEVYEKRDGNTTEGRMLYSWTFTGKDITSPEGPYFLGINTYSGDIVSGLPGGTDALYFSFACKRDLPGKAMISMYVGERFEDNTELELCYYGGYDSTVIHASTPAIESDEILTTDSRKDIAKGLTVKGGYVDFIIRYGGNYFLTEDIPRKAASEDKIVGGSKNSDGDRSTETSKDLTDASETKNNKSSGQMTSSKEVTASDVDNASKLSRSNQEGDPKEKDKNSLPVLSRDEVAAATPQTGANNTNTVYSEEASLGRISEVFPTDNIADAVAESLSKNITDEISQADLNGIKKLYLSGKELQNIDELSKVKFERLESLELAKNSIDHLPMFQMPMLSYIDLSNNSLTDATVLTEMQGLEVILLKDNCLTKIPEISRLSELVSFDASNNQINTLPELKSASLAYLDLSNNKIAEITGLQGLPNLEYINISGNSIEKLPDFTVCDKLTEVMSKQNIKVGNRSKCLAVGIVTIVILGIVFICIGYKVISYRNDKSIK